MGAKHLDWGQNGMTAGVNAVHRIAPLSLLPGFSDSELIALSHQESRLTHWSPISQHVCAIYVAMCRRLLVGEEFSAVLKELSRIEGEASPTNPLNFGPSDLLACDREETAHVLRMAVAWKENPRAKKLKALSKDGFSVEALKAALYFVGT